ncbi:3'-5' exonuclease [Boseongicola aestuarii]|uniref:DNA-directed DNA polymerase n=1 Tax=Boseongicola aestuarii TaxID=1470561 RepID=A0A238IVN8_9RHOB|nr:3'-5' exonuclease [Boseongicola aestuarii]SMX22073.1 DNA polymerase III PolC-type [Boseongicola aestuarii]
MLTRLPLRLRIFLFFCLLAAGGAALAAAALAFGWSRANDTLPQAPFITTFVIFVFLNTGLALAVWLLFDENVAKPINRLSAHLRLSAHSDVETPVDEDTARYLGDLAPAAAALTQSVSTSVMDTASKVARETQRLRSESERLTKLLTEIPIATLLLNPSDEIVLYDGQAAGVLSQIAPPRLKAPLSDYFDLTGYLAAKNTLTKTSGEVPFKLTDTDGKNTFAARLKALGTDGHMVFIEPTPDQIQPHAPRPLVFDFDLMNTAETREIKDTPLSDLCFVPFDTETTGLSVETDAIVQIGAVRVLNGRIVEGERLDTYINPGRPIPPASTRIHKVTDDHVKGAPDIATAGRALHHFARNAVLVAHNAPFDIGLLRRFQAEMDVDWTHPVLDTVLLSAVVFGTNDDHSLDALANRLNIAISEDDRHTAIGDAKATAEVLVKLLPLLQGKGILTFGALIEQTQKHGRLLHDLNS